MPAVGETMSRRKPSGALAWYTWAACLRCGKERWVQGRNKKLAYYYCYRCAIILHPRPSGLNHPSWRGGRYTTNGYFLKTLLLEEAFFRPMAKAAQGGGYAVLEHRLVMAKSLGRNLQRWEFVHHKNGIRHDNRLENLELTTNGSHIIEHNKGYRDGYQKGLRDGTNKQIQKLREENRILRNQTQWEDD